MRIGIVFPQGEIGNDPLVIRDWAQAAEGLGYDHILFYDHVLGPGRATRPGLGDNYTSDNPIHEVFVLMGYLAGQTSRIGLATGVLILPQRQTALVAKQAAEVDLLSGGRLRLGVGIGWNAVEYEGLNEDFQNRGARSEEQIKVLRALWSDTAITYRGRWHTIDDAGINPLPVQRPIPIWIGGMAEATLKRAGRLGDAWLPLPGPLEEIPPMLERLRGYAREAGRDPSAIGIGPQLVLSQVGEGGAADYAARWRDLGATHLSVNVSDLGITGPQAQIDKLRAVKELLW
ncbi:MAG TPA: LLM class F420-dependent oxidoreductase [Gemmatimonadales bacterium]|nr:LLM class F420-dependent oxidoreductase [Gemmatimonadales bacterium]